MGGTCPNVESDKKAENLRGAELLGIEWRSVRRCLGVLRKDAAGFMTQPFAGPGEEGLEGPQQSVLHAGPHPRHGSHDRLCGRGLAAPGLTRCGDQVREHRKAGTLLVPEALLATGRLPPFPQAALVMLGASRALLPLPISLPGPSAQNRGETCPLHHWPAGLLSLTHPHQLGVPSMPHGRGTGWHRALQAFLLSGPCSPSATPYLVTSAQQKLPQGGTRSPRHLN